MNAFSFTQSTLDALAAAMRDYHVDHSGLPPGSHTAAAVERAWENLYSDIFNAEHATLNQLRGLQGLVQASLTADSDLGTRLNWVVP